MIEFQIPFVCLIFTILISIIFFTKKKIDLEENYYYKNILIFTLLVNLTNFISHYLASVFAQGHITEGFATVFSNINKLGSLFIVIITTNILSYILYISFPKYRESYIVTIMDKYSACLETYLYLKHKLQAKSFYRYAYIFLSMVFLGNF